jgi:hypothetical protein
VLLDTRAPGVVVSEGFKGAALLGLFFGLREIAADVRVEEDGIVAELPDFEGEPASVAAPWKAVFLIGSNEDGARVYAWPEDYPDEIRKGVHLVQDLAKRGADPIEAVGKVEGVVPVDANTKFVLGIGRDPQGRYVMGLRQPFGKNANGQDMSVELQFMLPLGVLH